MSTSAKALIKIEGGQSLVAFAALTDSGDNRIFNPADNVMSGRSTFEPIVLVNGIVTGANLGAIAVSGSNDVVDIGAFTANSTGVLRTVAATVDESITRPATAVAKINSVTMVAAGTIAVIAGTDSLSAAFSEVRGAAGGPPYIPTDSVELFQVRVGSDTPAPIVSNEIFQVVGTHAERADFPSFAVNNIGQGSNAANTGNINAYVEFGDALPQAHTGDLPKETHVQYYSPTLQDLARTLDFVPVETTHSVTSTEFYNGSIGSQSSAIGQGGFTALLEDGVLDTLVSLKNELLTFQFFPDRNKAPFVLTQGTLGIARTFPTSDQNQAACTITAETISAEFSS